jgi:hypothetical protein
VPAAGCTRHGRCFMWFFAIVAGVVIVIMTGLLAGRARRAGRPALGGLARAAGLPVFGASIFIAFGLALHHVDWMTLALLLLVYAVYAIWHTLRHRRTNI